MEALAVFLVALLTALATGLGAVPFVFARSPSRGWLGTANSLAAGLMLGASAGLLYEGAGHGVERTALGADRVLRAEIRFSRSARGQEVKQDIDDEIRTNISVGYIPKKVKLIEENEESGDL